MTSKKRKVPEPDRDAFPGEFDELTHEIAAELGETKLRALSKIVVVTSVLGPDRTRLILNAAKMLYEAGGIVMMSKYARYVYGFKRRRSQDKPRTLGGVFFHLATLHPELLPLLKDPHPIWKASQK